MLLANGNLWLEGTLELVQKLMTKSLAKELDCDLRRIHLF